MTHPQSDVWFPLLEANQGTLTLLALAFAIGWGLWEQHRANTAEEKRQRRAITSADEIIRLTGNMLHRWQERNLSFSVVRERLCFTADALRDFASANASMPMLAITVLRAAR